MLSKTIATLFLLISPIYGLSMGLRPLTASEEYTRSSVIDEDMPDQFVVFWKPLDNDEIQFEVHCKTTGWVGFGLSLNGGMRGADMAIGWILDSTGQPFLKDTHANGFATPQTDPQQDWYLIDAAQIDGYTIIKMKRKLNTCDLEHDVVIKPETNYLIVAWNDADPVTGNNDWKYHGPNRRSKVEFLLLFKEETLSEIDAEVADAITYDLRIPNRVLKTQRTFYWCQLFEQPEFDTDVHIIRYDMLISKENQRFVHHVDFYECPYSGDMKADALALEGAECGAVLPPDSISYCYFGQQLFAWSVGGLKNFTFPKIAGLPIYKTAGKKYFMFEVHYENPDLVPNVVDNSGVRFYYTSKLRPQEVGILSLGSDIQPLDLTIPPKIEGLTFISTCHAECTERFIPPEGITVFSGNLHTHLAGRAIGTKLVRNNRIVKYLVNNPRYDFNYQFNIEIEPFKLYKGDVLVTYCTYASMDREKPTFWGLGTYDEMCIDFVYYYPRMKGMRGCITKPTPESLFGFYRNLSRDGLMPEMDLDEEKYEESTAIIKQTLETKTVFTDKLRARFVEYYSNVGEEYQNCGMNFDPEESIVQLKKKYQEYPDDVSDDLEKECRGNSSPENKTSSFSFLLLITSLLIFLTN